MKLCCNKPLILGKSTYLYCETRTHLLYVFDKKYMHARFDNKYYAIILFNNEIDIWHYISKGSSKRTISGDFELFTFLVKQHKNKDFEKQINKIYIYNK